MSPESRHPERSRHVLIAEIVMFLFAGSKSYQNSLSQDVYTAPGASEDGFAAKFTLSSNYQAPKIYKTFYVCNF
jgi:hypothetical protein